jgi:GT2 family glycosyltransferase
MTAAAVARERLGVSIVLPCYNRGAYLAHWLAACAWWRPYEVPIEVLVVDDGGTDDAGSVADRWRAQGLDVRYLRLRDAGAPRNNAQARNAGIRAARFPLVLNSDPDIVFVTDIVRRLVDAWRPGVFCSVGGYYPLTRTAARDLWQESTQRPLGPADYLERAAGRHNLVHRPDGVHGLHGAFLCDRATLHDVRGYDERFRLWGWEDRDLLTRLEEGLGLERIYVPEAIVVHEWHPALRADGEPLDDASRARTLWQMGWQQACAATLTSTARNPAGWGGEADEPTDPQQRAAEGRAPACASPAEWQMCFEAYLHEAAAWRRDGRPRAAMARLRVGLSRWWERGADEPPWSDEEGGAEALEAQVAAAHAARYARARELALAYAAAAFEAADRPAADSALAAASCLPGPQGPAAHLRARWLIEDGRLDEAVALLEEAFANDGPGFATGPADGPEAVATLIELLVRLGHDARARSWVAAAPPGLGVFEALLFAGYRARLFGAADPARGPWPPRVGDEGAGEFLFSVAMRARRAGLWMGAHALFDAYLASVPEESDDLPARAARLRDEAAREWASRAPQAPCLPGGAR